MALTTVYETDADISLVIFIVEAIITALLFLIGLLEPERELREVFEYRNVQHQGFVRIRGHSYVKPSFLVHFFTLGVGYAILLILVTIAKMGCGMIGAFVATDRELVLLEPRNWKTCGDWAAEDQSNRLRQGIDFANFVCANFSGEESSGVFVDDKGLRCSDFKFKHASHHCTTLGAQLGDNCSGNTRLKTMNDTLGKGRFFGITELRSWARSTQPNSGNVWAEFGTNGTIFGKELVVTCELGAVFEDLDSAQFFYSDFKECIFAADGVYFFTPACSLHIQGTFLGRRFTSIEEKIRVLIVEPARVIGTAGTGVLVDMGQIVEHSTLTNIDIRLITPDRVDAMISTFFEGERLYNDLRSMALCFSRQTEALDQVTKRAIEVRWWVVMIILLILGMLLAGAVANKFVIRRQEFRLNTPSGREADRYVHDVLRKEELHGPHVKREVIGVIQESDCDRVGVTTDELLEPFGRRIGFHLR